MSSKTRTRKTRTTTTGMTDSARTLRPVLDQRTTATVRTDTEDKLWAALHANPNSIAADLSGAAKIGRSAAQRILVNWAGDGSVTRSAGIAEGGRRAADLWAITEVDGAPVNDADSADARVAPDSPLVPDPTDTATPAEGDPTELTTTEPSDAVADDTADTEASAPAEDEPAVAGVTGPTNDGVATDADTATDGSGDEKADGWHPARCGGWSRTTCATTPVRSSVPRRSPMRWAGNRRARSATRWTS